MRSTDRIVIEKSQDMTDELVQTKAALQSLQAGAYTRPLFGSS